MICYLVVVIVTAFVYKRTNRVPADWLPLLLATLRWTRRPRIVQNQALGYYLSAIAAFALIISLRILDAVESISNARTDAESL